MSSDLHSLTIQCPARSMCKVSLSPAVGQPQFQQDSHSKFLSMGLDVFLCARKHCDLSSPSAFTLAERFFELIGQFTSQINIICISWRAQK